VSGLLIGYARLSTDAQDLTAQRDGLRALGVEPERVYAQPRRVRARPHGPGRALLFNVLAMVAEFEADLLRARTREGMKVAKAKAPAAPSEATRGSSAGFFVEGVDPSLSKVPVVDT
jgi:DNA invertase Pin-like site-specific DNA recombinase